MCRKPTTNDDLTRCIHLKNPLVQLCVPNVGPIHPTSGNDPTSGKLHILSTMDWLHIGWRLRRMLLDVNRRLTFCGLIISHTHLLQHMDEFGLCYSDVDASNKQSYTGMLRIFDFALERGVIKEVSTTCCIWHIIKDYETYILTFFNREASSGFHACITSGHLCILSSSR